MECVFCNIEQNAYIAQSECFYAIADRSPVTKGHTLLVSKRHFKDFFEINEQEMGDLREFIQKLKGILDAKYAPDAYNIGMNCGAAAGQTVFHYHLHLIPRYTKDNSLKNRIKGMREYVNEII